jgi:hypothetical protein
MMPVADIKYYNNKLSKKLIKVLGLDANVEE